MVGYRLISTLMTSKLLGNLGLLVLYPLAPFLETTWNLSSKQMNLLNVISEVAAFPAGFVTVFGDKYDNYYLITFAWLVSMLSIFALLAPPLFGTLLAVRFIFNFAYTIFQASLQSAMVGMVAVEHRSWVTGLLEFSWALAVMFMGVLVVVFNYLPWRVTFGLLGCLMVPCLWEMFHNFPRKVQPSAPVNSNSNEEELKPLNHFWKCFTSGTIAFCLSGVFINIAHNAIFTVVFYWAADEYNFSSSDMAYILLSIGGGEFVGSILVTLLADRAIYLGIYIATVAFAAGIIGFIFAAHVSATAGIVVLFFLYIGGEYAFVVSIAEVEAYLPAKYRSSLIGIHFQAQFIGRAIGAQITDMLYSKYGIDSIGYASLVSLVAHTGCIYWAYRCKPPRIEE